MSNNILIVDDSRVVRRTLEKLLREAGYQTLTAASGPEALEKIRETPALVILDIQMPEMNGLQVLEKIKADPSTRDIPAVMLTSMTDMESRVFAFEIGADDYIMKPFHEREVLARIGRLLKVKAAWEEELLRKSEQTERYYGEYQAIREFNERVIESIGEGLAVMDLEGNVQKLNQKALDIFRVTLEADFIGGPIGAIHPALEEFLRSEQWPFAGELALPDGDGREKILEFSSSRLFRPGGGPQGIITIFRDLTGHRKMEAALHDSEEIHRTVLNSVTDAIFVTDDRGNFTFVCGNVEDIFGCSPADIYGMKDIQSLLAKKILYPNLLETLGEISNVELEIRDALGEIRTLLISMKKVSIRGGTTLFVCRDITRRIAAQKGLRFSHRMLEIANRATEIPLLLHDFIREVKNFTGLEAVGIRILDERGMIPYLASTGFNEVFFRMESPLSVHRDQCLCISVIKGETGPGRDSWTGFGSFFHNCTTAFQDDLPEEAREKMRSQCHDFGFESLMLVPIRFQDQILGLAHLADRRENQVSLEFVKLLEEATLQLGIAIHRIRGEETIRNQRAEALRFKTFLEMIMQSMAAGLLVLDHEERVITLNRSGEQILGVAAGEIAGKQLEECHPDLARVLTAAASSTSIREVEIKRKNGEIIPLGLATTGFDDPASRQTGRIVVFNDLSGIKELEKKLAEGETLAAIGKIAGGIAHEIKNPLFAITSGIQLLESDLDLGLSASQRRAFELILSETLRVNRLIKELMSYSRAQTRRELKLSAFPVRKLIEEVVDLNQGLLKSREIETEITASDSLPAILVDRDQMIQVMINLLQNAIDASEPGDRIFFRAGAYPEGERITVEVEDQGPGVPAEIRDRIFEPFFSTKKGNSGMGLAISRKIVLDHGGEIRLESEEGKGAKFVVELPIK